MFRGMLLRRSLSKVVIIGLLLLFGVAAAIFSRSPGAARAATSGPIAEFSFDEGEIGTKGGTLDDLSEHGHDGIVEGAEWVHGRYGGALKFNGAENVVKIPNSSEFDLGEEFTIEAWVRPEAGAYDDTWAPIVSKETGGGGHSTELAWWLYEGDWERNVPFGGIEPNSEEENTANAQEPLPVDVWSHLALTWNGYTVSLYVDGELVDHWHSPPPPVTEGEVELGAESEHGDHFVGRID
jgi:hypothetical protein